MSISDKNSMYKKIHIGIDLSSNKSGVAILRYGAKTLTTSTFLIDTTNCQKEFEYFKKWNVVVNEIIQTKIGIDHWTNNEILLGIEVSNFGNPRDTQKFSLIAGMIISLFLKYKEVEIKLYNSNQWQKLIGCEMKDTREIRKKKSIEFAKNKFKIQGEISDDIADSLNQAYFLDKLQSTLEQSIQVKTKKISKNKKIKEIDKSIIRKQQHLLTIKKELEELDPIRNKRRIETIKNNIVKVENTIQELKNEKKEIK